MKVRSANEHQHDLRIRIRHIEKHLVDDTGWSKSIPEQEQESSSDKSFSRFHQKDKEVCGMRKKKI